MYLFVSVFLAFFHFPRLSSPTFSKLLKLPAPITSTITVSLPVCFHLPKPSPTPIPGQPFLGLCLLLLFRDLFSFQLSNPKLIPLPSFSNTSFHLHSNILWSHTLKQTKQENKNMTFPSIPYRSSVTILFYSPHIQTSLKQLLHSCSFSSCSPSTYFSPNNWFLPSPCQGSWKDIDNHLIIKSPLQFTTA